MGNHLIAGSSEGLRIESPSSQSGHMVLWNCRPIQKRICSSYISLMRRPSRSQMASLDTEARGLLPFYAILVQLDTFTVLRQNALTFTLSPPYDERTRTLATRLGSRTPGHAGLTPPPGTRPQRRDRRERRCKHPGAPVLPRHNRDVPSRNTRLVVTLSRQQALKLYQSSQRPLEGSSRRRWWRRWLSYMTRLRRCRPTELRSRDFHRRRPR